MGVLGRAENVQRFLAGTSVSLVGLALLGIPLYDVWDDVTNLDWHLWATIAENGILILLALVIVAGGVWLSAHDWNVSHILTVTKWTLFGALSTAVVFTIVLAVQLWAIHEPKPYVIALDGILIGTVGAFGIGVYNARTNIRTEQLAAERDRFIGLFQNTTDAIAVVAATPDESVVSEVNNAFRETFGHDVEGLFEGVLPADVTREDLLDRARNGEVAQLEFRHPTETDESREYLLQLVPYDRDADTTYMYVIITDITDQVQLSRQQDANERMRFLHDVATELTAVETADQAHALVMDSLRELVDAQAMRLVLDGDSVVTRTADGTDSEPVDDERQAFTAAVGSRGHIEIYSDEVTDSERIAVDLLGTYLDRTLTRIDREHELEMEREHLEFVNRTLRHNLLNDLQVIRSRIELLEPDPASFAEHADIMDERIDDMAAFIQEMRTYMQHLLESEEHELQSMNLRQVLQEEVESVQVGHPSADIILEDIPDVTVDADELLGPLFENLLTNAVVHNDQDEPTIHVAGERTHDEVTIYVRDDGPGIPDSLKADIFDRGETHFDSPGTGFGLYLVQQAVETYGGDIEVVDNDPRGTEFRVTLPISDTF